MQCPQFNLDYCYSYESEDSRGRMISLLAGKLKMGMFAVPTEEYLKEFRAEGRSVVQHALNLPPQAKQELWRHLDGKVAEGIQLPYDALRRGCAQSVLEALRVSLSPHRMEIGKWPVRFSKTRRELVEAVVNDRRWDRLLLHTFSGMELDREVSRFEKVVTPHDLVEILGNARVEGTPVLGNVAKSLVEGRAKEWSTPITPMAVSIAVVAVAAANMFLNAAWVGYAFLALQALFGAGLSYLVFVSDLFGTDWNWLIVPFNLLPLVFWKWRRKWALWFAGLLVAWEAFMIFHPHRLTDPAYLVLVGAYIVMYVRMGLRR